jgi:hypothetical protein
MAKKKNVAPAKTERRIVFPGIPTPLTDGDREWLKVQYPDLLEGYEKYEQEHAQDARVGPAPAPGEVEVEEEEIGIIEIEAREGGEE